MAKKKRKKKGEKRSLFTGLQEETVRGVWAVLLFVVAALLLLAASGRAGVVGDTLYGWFSYALGVGYFLLPLLAIMVGAALIGPFTRDVGATRTIGGTLFLLSGLGAAEVLFEGGGLAGTLVAAPLLSLFEFYATLLLLIALLLISLLIIFDIRFSFSLSPLTAPFRLLREKLHARREYAREAAAKPADDSDEYDADEDEYEEAAEEEDDAPAEGEEEAPEDEEEPVVHQPGSGTKTRSKKEATEMLGAQSATVSTIPYSPPPLSILKSDSGKPGVGDVKANANIVKRTLQNFGIQVEMDEVSIGPSVTRYALKPAEGVRLSRIISLQNNLELALAASPVRIEAPIPGRALVGIEVPNHARATIGLGSLLASDEYTQSDKPLLVALGKDISGSNHFANLAKMPHLLVAGATGAGKTCGKDTYIFSENGMQTFEELCPLPLNTETDCQLSVATRDGVEQTSKNYNNGVCDFYRITTEEGYTVDVTAEHPLWTIVSGSMGWQQGADIRIGEYVAISRGAHLFGTDQPITFTPAPNKTNKAREIRIPEQMGSRFGLFMGLLSADGGLSVGHRIVYTQADTKLLALYKELLAELFGITVPIIAKSGKSNKAKDIVVNSKHLKDLLASLGMGSERAQEKEIPRAVRSASAETVKAFIRGFVRNDGHISAARGLEITLANYTLLHQLQLLLLNFGIVSTLHTKTVPGYEHNEYWRLNVYGSEFATYAETVGFLTREEYRKARHVRTLQHNANRDVIPSVAPLLKRLAHAYRATFARLTNRGWQYDKSVAVPKYAFGSLRSYNSGARRPSYKALSQILSFYKPIANEPEYQQLADIQKAGFYWARVAHIERTRGVGYDFEVPGSNSFVGNGFINHNSVAIHSIITSLLYRNSPEMLRFLMVDPKRVELTLYKGIPHLLTPVITDAKKAILALKWAAKEMDRRYDILEAETVRDIGSYHTNVVEPARAELAQAAQRGDDEHEAAEQLPEPMPYIVIVIDELADLMHAYPRELESAIVRIAQMSRAVGIHVILSTQRPSVNVITGLIKANIPSRVALQVSSQVDSRTILDSGGAERLLGAGDMLYLSGDRAKSKRLQSPFISEDEVKKVVRHLQKAYKGNMPEDDLSFSSEAQQGQNIFAAGEDEAASEEDDLFDDARETVISAQKASTSFLQRKLRIGYARAARLMDMLEEHGVVGPADGAKPRDVLVKQEDEQDEGDAQSEEAAEDEGEEEEEEQT